VGYSTLAALHALNPSDQSLLPSLALDLQAQPDPGAHGDVSPACDVPEIEPSNTVAWGPPALEPPVQLPRGSVRQQSLVKPLAAEGRPSPDLGVSDDTPQPLELLLPAAAATDHKHGATSSRGDGAGEHSDETSDVSKEMREPLVVELSDDSEGDFLVIDDCMGDVGTRWHAGHTSYAWLYQANSRSARAERRQICKHTEAVVHRGGYIIAGDRVALPGQPTWRRVRREAELRPYSEYSCSGKPAQVFLSSDTVPATAIRLGDKKTIGVFCASSGYHVGGGFLTGGRHALEESLCVQTTMWAALNDASKQPPPWLSDGSVLVVSNAAVFRRGVGEGYKFLQRSVPVCVICVAAYNKNPRVMDSPVDAPDDEDEYQAGLLSRFRLAVHSAAEQGVRVLVVTDVGCGVFQNCPADVGHLMGRALEQPVRLGVFDEVHVTGRKEFQEWLQHALSDCSASAQVASPSDTDGVARSWAKARFPDTAAAAIGGASQTYLGISSQYRGARPIASKHSVAEADAAGVEQDTSTSAVEPPRCTQVQLQFAASRLNRADSPSASQSHRGRMSQQGPSNNQGPPVAQLGLELDSEHSQLDDSPPSPPLWKAHTRVATSDFGERGEKRALVYDLDEGDVLWRHSSHVRQVLGLGHRTLCDEDIDNYGQCPSPTYEYTPPASKLIAAEVTPAFKRAKLERKDNGSDRRSKQPKPGQTKQRPITSYLSSATQ